MKIKILIGVVVLALLGVGAFVVSSQEVKKDPEEMEKMRGTERYYVDSKSMTQENPYGEDLLANLSDGQVAKMSFNVKYKIGLEWAETPEMAMQAFAEKASEIRSELILMLSSKTAPDFRGAKLVIFQNEVLEMINDIVFPKKRARVEAIVFKSLLVQG